jgi:hypothetical protein
MSRRTAPFRLALILAFLAAAAAVHAELLVSESGFYIDMPEGFSLEGGDGKTRFTFLSPDEGMEAAILSYDRSRYADAEALATDALGKLGSKGERETYNYQGLKCVFAELSFEMNGEAKKGYAVFVGPPAKAAAGSGKLEAVLAYTGADRLQDYADFIFSILDSFSADRAALRAPGPVSQFLLAWPARREETKTLRFGTTEFDLPWNSEEATNEGEIVGREFRVLQSYAKTEDLWQPAWARTYRMIYRESAARLDRLALQLDMLLPEDPTDAARALLQWTQGFSYERDLEGADFVDPLTAAYEGRGDCDSRAMVAAIILERRGVDSILMVSPEYSHALLGVDVPGGGQRFKFAGKDYLVGETTAKVGLGMIAADQADWSKWIGIQLGD